MTVANIAGTRIRLQVDNFTVIQHAWNSGGVGRLVRDAGANYDSETYLRFDTSGIPVGSTINSCTLDVSLSVGSTPTGLKISQIFENNVTDPVAMTNPPRYDDFPYALWTNSSTVKTSQNVEAPGNYTYPSTAAFVAMVDGWVQGIKDWEWGCFVTADFEYFGWYHFLDSATLNVDYDEPVLSKIRLKGTARGTSRGTSRGM